MLNQGSPTPRFPTRAVHSVFRTLRGFSGTPNRFVASEDPVDDFRVKRAMSILNGVVGDRLEEGTIPERYRLTWNRFRLKKRLDWLRNRRAQLRRRIRSRDEGARIPTELSLQIERIDEEIKSLKDHYQPLNERYRNDRDRLEERRENFIRRRKRVLDEYRRRRLRQRQQMREERQQGQEEMLKRREEAMSNFK